MKYIIEFEDEPYMREDGVNYYTCKSARRYKLGDTIINRLTPYNEFDRKAIEDEVWGLARRIICPSDCCKDIISAHTKEIFNKEGWEIRGIFNDLSYQEAKAKYDEWLKQKDEIRVGDEIVSELTKTRGVVFAIDAWDAWHGVSENGYVMDITDGMHKCWKKTGRHFPEVAELLEKMKGEEG